MLGCPTAMCAVVLEAGGGQEQCSIMQRLHNQTKKYPDTVWPEKISYQIEKQVFIAQNQFEMVLCLEPLSGNDWKYWKLYLIYW